MSGSDAALGLKDQIDLSLKAITTLIATLTAFWAWFRFRREREHAPRIAFTLDCQFFGPQKGKYLAELQITAENLGKTRQQFEHIKVRIRGISKDSELVFWDSAPPRAFFPHKLYPSEGKNAADANEIDAVYQKFAYVFVEPGVKQMLTYVTLIPEGMRFIVVRATFKYPNHNDHSAEKVFEVTTK